jgi:hypothetical protein
MEDGNIGTLAAAVQTVASAKLIAGGRREVRPGL